LTRDGQGSPNALEHRFTLVTVLILSYPGYQLAIGDFIVALKVLNDAERAGAVVMKCERVLQAGPEIRQRWTPIMRPGACGDVA